MRQKTFQVKTPQNDDHVFRIKLAGTSFNMCTQVNLSESQNQFCWVGHEPP